MLLAEDLLDCAYKRPEDHESTLLIAAYVMAGICALCVIPLAVLIGQWLYTKARRLMTSSQPAAETTDINDLLPEITEEEEPQESRETSR